MRAIPNLTYDMTTKQNGKIYKSYKESTMTENQLRKVMKFHLKNFNDEGVLINDDTIFSTVLSESDGFGAANSKTIFRAIIRWTLKRNGHTDKPWPSDWFNSSVKTLSSKII
jgi:hypothetical protein